MIIKIIRNFAYIILLYLKKICILNNRYKFSINVIIPKFIVESVRYKLNLIVTYILNYSLLIFVVV